MKEILMVNVGQAGVRIGDQSWSLFIKQHKINKMGEKAQDSVYDSQSVFIETAHKRFVPRNIFVDTDPDSINQIRRGQRRDIYSSSSLISCKQDTSNNYVRGHFTIGKQIIDITLDQIRKIIESCNNLEGIVINHALSGGTGSGFSNLLIDRLENQSIIRKKVIISNLICPSPNISDTIVQPYNVVLGLADLSENRSQKIVNCFDNQKIYNKCQQNGIDSPSYDQVNKLIAKSISLFTHHYRLQPHLHNLYEIHSNMVPYNALCFLQPKINQQTLAKHQRNRNFIRQMWNHRNSLSSYAQYTKQKTEFSMSNFLRGNACKFDIFRQFQSYKQNANHINWCKTGFKLFSNQIDICPNQFFFQGLTLINNNNMSGLLEKCNLRYDRLFQKRAFVHWYVGQGIQHQSFTWGRQHLAILQKDYQEAAIFTNNQEDDFIYE